MPGSSLEQRSSIQAVPCFHGLPDARDRSLIGRAGFARPQVRLTTSIADHDESNVMVDVIGSGWKTHTS
jgi:hypothetical protein